MSLVRRLLRRSRDRSEQGQVLVMVAASLTVLLGFSALVTDLGMLWTIQQSNRSIADSAVLAGAQEMQIVGLRGINPAARAEARAAAVANVMDRVNATGMPSCAVGGPPTDTDGDGKLGYDADVHNCPMPGTDYFVSALAPSALCVTCELPRSMMVEVTRNDVPTFFAGLFGFDGFTARQTSVATITYTADFAVLTLRPPDGGTTNQDNITVSGSGTTLTVSVGDVGTNTNMVLSGGATVLVDEGYKVHHYDAVPAWTPPPPPNKLASFIQDPMHTYPTRTGAPTFNNDGQAATTAAVCDAARAAVPSTYRAPFPSGLAISDPAMTSHTVRCVKPGIYNYGLRSNTGEVLILTPGVYFLDSGLTVRGILIGGYAPAPSSGVTLVFNETTAGRLDANNSEIFALNGGSRFNNCTPTCSGFEAAPAIGFDGDGIDTCGASCPIGESNLSLTIMVTKDPNCIVTTPYPTACDDNHNNALNMAGGGALYLAGVQYAPTDNVAISGGSSGEGKAGRIISWTVSYSGGARITQTYPGVSEGPGTIRLDAACTGAGTTGMSNASCNP